VINVVYMKHVSGKKDIAAVRKDIKAALWTPSEYCSPLQKHVGKDQLGAMKSHDHHVLHQQILPVAICDGSEVGSREAITLLDILVDRVCAKVIDPDSFPAPYRLPMLLSLFVFSRFGSHPIL